MNIDSELLISLVEERPCVWDKTLEAYKDRNLINSAWREICMVFLPNFHDITEEQRCYYVKFVLKKWTHMRDNWIKSARKIKEQRRCEKSGLPVKASRPYIYKKQMNFLKKVVRNHETSVDFDNDSTSVIGHEESLNNIIQSPTQKRKPKPHKLFVPCPNSDVTSPMQSESESRASSMERTMEEPMAEMRSDQGINFLNKFIERLSPKDDRHDIFGKNVACKLRHLPVDQRILAEKIINDTLYEAEINNLSHNTELVSHTHISVEHASNRQICKKEVGSPIHFF